MSNRNNRGWASPVALAGCVLAASLVPGCSEDTKPDPALKVEKGAAASESLKTGGRPTGKTPAEPGTIQRKSSRPG